eukprot:13169959-Alexandrium_andersonii.AAC.1
MIPSEAHLRPEHGWSGCNWLTTVPPGARYWPTWHETPKWNPLGSLTGLRQPEALYIPRGFVRILVAPRGDKEHAERTGAFQTDG